MADFPVTCADCGQSLRDVDETPCPNCGSDKRNVALAAATKFSVSGRGKLSVFRDEYIEAMTVLAQACDDVAARGYERPVVVGGAAVEFYTGGAVVSGDIDFVSAWQRVFEAALIERGFIKEDRQGHILRGLYHPGLSIAVEVVASRLFDGNTDRDRIRLVDIADGAQIEIAPVEDLIADRLAQYLSNPAGMEDRRGQAVKLYQLAQGLDEAYLDKRIRDETFRQLGLADLKDMAS